MGDMGATRPKTSSGSSRSRSPNARSLHPLARGRGVIGLDYLPAARPCSVLAPRLVAVRGAGGQKEAVLEPRREVAPRAGEVRVDGVLSAARRRRVVRLVEDQHRAWIEAPEPVAEVGYSDGAGRKRLLKPARDASVWSLGSVMPTS